MREMTHEDIAGILPSRESFVHHFGSLAIAYSKAGLGFISQGKKAA